ncbi:hypothetical protein PM3016_4884 [Paenibacillus mucilaginosus 3016]|uniref:Uncharacterized protein n=1 Tax=Paenibacillus mucilaginosus 3016 TaxID=1116391 RepID=H6NKD4_9BACL|nr:hypothetical protein [Paenibacillus mucilaginosus]AFC31618.1 hypothetical protein PM3016_4884 [Paenibacillus mucilaginosus 3016]
MQPALAPQVGIGHEPGRSRSEEQRQPGGAAHDDRRIAQRPQQTGLPQELPVVAQRQARFIHEAQAGQLQQRQHEEQEQQREAGVPQQMASSPTEGGR